jgi:ribosome-binding ATPase YchF (GTP1/OBG family)
MLESQHYSIVYQMQKRKVLTFLLYIEPNIGVVNVPDPRINKIRGVSKTECKWQQ